MNPPPPPPVVQAPPTWDGHLTFGDLTYHHRWSKAGHHEFTPVGQEELRHWVDLLTVVRHDQVRSGEQLAGLAHQVLERYRTAGRILRTESVPRREQGVAEHLAVALLRSPEGVEWVFTRFVLVDGRGMVVVRSRRFPGLPTQVTEAATEWLLTHGPRTERILMGWAVPAPALFDSLPQTR